jgi:hypothetical protein
MTDAHTILSLIGGIAAGQAMVAAVELGLPDALASSPRTGAELAEALGARARVVERLARVLATHGVLTATSDGRFALTAAGQLLRRDHPASLAARVLCIRHETTAALGALARAAHGPPSAFEHAHGMTLWAWLERHPTRRQAFLEFMGASLAAIEGPVVDAVDWAPLRTVVDVGGAHGTLLRTALLAHPHLRGVLFDRAEAIADAPWAGEGWQTRCERVSGDYLASVPPGDAYLLCRVLHGWDDAGSVRILTRCRAAMNPGGRVLVVERVRRAWPLDRTDAVADLRTLAHTGGEERTRDDFARVFDAAGLRLARVSAAGAWMSVLEGVASEPG